MSSIFSDPWKVSPGGKYFLTRNGTTIFAFTVGAKWNSENTGFKIVGCHTDSPCLRLAPISKLQAHSYHQCCVSPYGGGLWHTWFDRDLTLAGRVLHRTEGNTGLGSRLFHYARPLLRIPNLAIHLRDAADRNKLEPNKENELRPIFSSEVYRQLTHGDSKKENVPLESKHYEGLLQLIARETGINSKDICDLDLCFVDTQPATLLGLDQDFISSARLDNLYSSYNALRALLTDDANSADDHFVNMVVLFDHEEVGSLSSQGAESMMLRQSLERLYNVLAGTGASVDGLEAAIARSLFISADMAHSVHPNYAGKHQELHRPQMNKGIVLKINVNQSYATDGISGSLFRLIAERANVPVQEFIVRSDGPCGTTIGPIVSARVGIKTLDIGAPQLSMHSIRELCGVLDGYYYHELFKGFFAEYQKLDTTILRS